MIDFRPVIFVLGILLSILAVAMMLPAVVDAASGELGVPSVKAGDAGFLRTDIRFSHE